ncbi:MAG TPA: hypothetical protein VFA04_14465 [Bryobacteraceae bacterium]|jgi:hypothetical protein|nr:hypothetical protein [Bryobacteraceae bacterium]
MRIAGLLLLPAGWLIALAAIVLLIAPVPRNGFVLAGVAVQLLGLVLVVRSHMPVRGARE